MHWIFSAIRDAEAAPVYEDPHLSGPEPDGVPGRMLLVTLLPHAERLLDRVMPEMVKGSRRCMEVGRRVLNGEAAPDEAEALSEVRHHAVAAGVSLMSHGILNDKKDIIKYGSGLCALWIARLMNDPEDIGEFQRELDHKLMLAEYEGALREEKPAARRVLWRAKGESGWICKYFIVELDVLAGDASRYAFYFSDAYFGKNARWLQGSRDEVLACVPEALFEAATAMVPE